MTTTGERFGRLTILADKRMVYPSTTRRGYLVRCDCGVEKVVPATDVERGRQVSCGCHARECHNEFCRDWTKRKQEQTP